MATISVTQSIPFDINIINTVNGGSSGNWVLGESSITHNNNIGSFAQKILPVSVVVGNTYRVTYTISSYTNCNVQLFFGTTAGTIRTSAGTFAEVLTLVGLNRISFYSSGTATISNYLIESLTTTISETPIGIEDMQNNSWTLSYNPILNQWISFHSYLPNNYVQHPIKLLAKENSSQLYLNNSGDFGKYFDEDIKPFIFETIFNEYKTDTKVFDSVRVIMDSSTSDGVFTNTFFDEGIVYTENQCSGVIEFTPNINITRKEKNWNFNNFSDITNNLAQKIFVSDWDSVSSSYPIDKIVNVNKIDVTKPWYQRGRMRDKYLAVRFIDKNLENNKFICKFVISSFRASQR